MLSICHSNLKRDKIRGEKSEICFLAARRFGGIMGYRWKGWKNLILMQYLLWNGRDWDKKDTQAKWTKAVDRMMFYRGPKIWDGLEKWMVFGGWGEAFQGENLEWGKTERLEYMQSIKMTQASSSVYILIYEGSEVRWNLMLGGA